MEFKDRLKFLRKLNGLTQEQVANAVGLKTPAIYKYENGLVLNPKRSLIEKLSVLFGVSPAYMMGLETESDLPSFQYIHIPVGISAGQMENCECLMNLPKVSVPDVIMGKYARDPNIVFMHVNGESMNHVISNGATIAVMTGVDRGDLHNGDIVIAYTGEGYTVKRYYDMPERQHIVLSPDSNDPTFMPILIPYDTPDGLRIFGKVVMYSVIL